MCIFLLVFLLITFNIGSVNAEIDQTLLTDVYLEENKKLDINKDNFFVVITIPKSGTNLLKLALEELTGRKSFGPTYSQECISKINNSFKDLTSFVIAHTTPSMFDYIDEQLPREVKIILMIRDLRDTVVSAVNYVDKNGVQLYGGLSSIISNEKWKKLSRKKKMELIINLQDYGNEYEFFIGSLIAKTILLSFPNVYVCRYENLIGSKGGGNDGRLFQELVNLATYVNVDVKTKLKQIQRMVHTLHGNKKSFTFHEGKMGKWKEEFDTDLKNLFKQKLGHTLIDWGYENDYNW